MREGWLAGGPTGAVIARREGLLSGCPAWRGEEMFLGVLGRGLLLGRPGLFLSSDVMGMQEPIVSGRAAARALSRMAVVVALMPPWAVAASMCAWSRFALVEEKW